MQVPDRDVEMTRPRAFRIAAGLFALLFGGLFFGFPGLILGWFETGDRLVHRVHDIGNGVLTGLLIAVPLIVLAARARRPVAALHQIAAASVALVLGAAVSADPAWLIFVVPGIVTIVVLLGIAGPALRRQFLSPERDPSPALALIPAVAAVPLTAYALSMAKLQRTGAPADSHVEEHHWAAMATVAFALVLVGLLAAVRPPGWRIPARCAAAGAMVFGLASVIFPNYPGSVGATWGLVALVGGAAFLAVGEWEAGRSGVRS